MVFANLAYNSSNLAQMKQNSRVGGGANGPSNGPSGPKVSRTMYFSQTGMKTRYKIPKIGRLQSSVFCFVKKQFLFDKGILL